LFTRYRARVPDFHVETIGSGPRVVLVHGSGNARTAWDGQRKLAARFTLVLPVRTGYPPNPPLERIDFERQAAELAPLLADGAHLVGHSYGGVISLLIAAEHPERVRSLVVSEPPAFGIADGHAAVDRLVTDLRGLFETELLEPVEHARRFVEIVGVDTEVSDPMPPELAAMTRAAMVERPPWEAEIPFEELRSAPFRKLVISGAHHPAFDAVCDVLSERLGAERVVLAGKGHGIPRAPGFNETLGAFLEAA
jgi:pimeloyl-ACP methyl ester carboxylesterase